MKKNPKKKMTAEGEIKILCCHEIRIRESMMSKGHTQKFKG